MEAVAVPSAGSLLQWSRADEGAEIGTRLTEAEILRRLQWSRADEGAEIRTLSSSTGTRLSGFNGAAPMKARKSGEPFFNLRLHSELQWSRADEGAEIRAAVVVPVAVHFASMEPRR